MASESDLIIEISGRDVPDDFVSLAKERLIREINELGPIATPVTSGASPGVKGDIVTLGQIALAFLSSGVALKSLASVVIEFIKRNPKLTVKCGELEISKDHASARDVDRLSTMLETLQSKKRNARK
jgi:hypothetical protein